MHRVGIRFNPLQGQVPSILPPCLLSINAIYRSNYLWQTRECSYLPGQTLAPGVGATEATMSLSYPDLLALMLASTQIQGDLAARCTGYRRAEA